MHLQENKNYLTFDIDLGVKVIQNIAQSPLHHMTNVNKVAMSKGLGDAFTRFLKKIYYLTIDLGVKVTQHIAQYPQHHVTYDASASLKLLHTIV